MTDPYLYPGTETLINSFDEHNEEKLKEIEANYTALRLRQLFTDKIKGSFDFEHLCKLHYFIFQDLYLWAGKPRTINIEKYEDVLGGLSVEYSDYKNIKSDAERILNNLVNTNWNCLSKDNLAETFSNNIAKLWKVHPFREGNTRTIITFLCDFADAHNFKINRTLFEQNSLFVRTALVAANAVFKDIGDKSNIKYLYTIVFDSLK